MDSRSTEIIRPDRASPGSSLEGSAQAEKIASGQRDGGTGEKAGEVEDIKAIIQVFCVGLEPQRASFFLVEFRTGGDAHRQSGFDPSVAEVYAVDHLLAVFG